jgi:glycosyltransferase involved in cell wall biosynthesis
MKVSIVTAVFNREDVISDAIRSVNAQRCDFAIEHVIIDGGSTDGTLAAIHSMGPRNPIIVSEPDGGIYEALNKGLRAATGDIIGLLHSDDVFADDRVLADVLACFRDDTVDLVYGDLVYVDQRDLSRVIRHWKAGTPGSGSLQLGWMPPHPTVFVRSDVYRRLGAFNQQLRIAADYELMLRMFLSGAVKHRYIDRVLVRMRAGGASNRSIRQIIRKSREDVSALRSNGFSATEAGWIVVMKNLRKIGQLFQKS